MGLIRENTVTLFVPFDGCFGIIWTMSLSLSPEETSHVRIQRRRYRAVKQRRSKDGHASPGYLVRGSDVSLVCREKTDGRHFCCGGPGMHSSAEANTGSLRSPGVQATLDEVSDSVWWRDRPESLTPLFCHSGLVIPFLIDHIIDHISDVKLYRVWPISNADNRLALFETHAWLLRSCTRL